MPRIDELHRRLAQEIPEERDTTVLHVDFRLDVLVDGDRLQVVLDWEMSTLVDPLTDVALMLLYAGRPVASAIGSPRPPPSVPEHPTVEEMAERSSTDAWMYDLYRFLCSYTHPSVQSVELYL